MWRLPLLNLLFAIVLITILALHHSAAVFVPAETSYEFANDGRLSERGRDDGSRGNELKTVFGYLRDLGQRSRIMQEWFFENQTFSWERLRPVRGAESDLVEARFHVANAEVFGVALVKKQRAKIELDRADGYLQKALPLVGQDMMPVLKAIEKELTDAKTELEMAHADAEASDEQIKTDLDWAIASLHGERL